MDELRVIVNLKNPDGIALTETWTNSEISDDYLGIDGYELIERKDREDTDRGRGGGILVYVAKGMEREGRGLFRAVCTGEAERKKKQSGNLYHL